jgi:hypothetical protein
MQELVQVEFQPGGQRYTYSTTEHVAVGDKVVVPTSNPFAGETTAVAEVVQIGSDFLGTPKQVIGKHREDS